jgi:hypothetical protein
MDKIHERRRGEGREGKRRTSISPRNIERQSSASLERLLALAWIEDQRAREESSLSAEAMRRRVSEDEDRGRERS